MILISQSLLILKELSFEQERLCVAQVVLSWDHNLLQSCHLLPFNFLVEGLIETVNFIDDLALLDQVHKVFFYRLLSVMELMCDLSDGNDFVSLYVLLQSFEANVSEDRHLFMLAKIYIVLQVVFNGFQMLLELKVVSIQKALNDVCCARRGLSQSGEIGWL